METLKKIPVTIGMLISFIIALGAAGAFVLKANSGVDSAIERSINYHQTMDLFDAHPSAVRDVATKSDLMANQYKLEKRLSRIEIIQQQILTIIKEAH